MIEINENFLIEVSKLKRQRLIIDWKFINLNIYHDKSFKKFKNWIRNIFNAFKINFHTFSRNELRSIEFSNSFATRRRSAEITKKKKFENYIEDVTIKKLFKLFNWFYEKFIKSTFYYCTEAWYNKIKLIIKCKRFCCVCRDFKNRL